MDELIDGNPVVSHVVRFKDRTTISETDAQEVRDGAVIVWIVRARCEPPSYHPVRKDSDDRYRFNVQTVQAAAVLHGELRDDALAYLDDPTQAQGRLRFDAPTYPEREPAEITSDLAFFETAEPLLGPKISPDALAGPDPEPEPAGDTVRIPLYEGGGSETHRLMAETWDDLS